MQLDVQATSVASLCSTLLATLVMPIVGNIDVDMHLDSTQVHLAWSAHSAAMTDRMCFQTRLGTSGDRGERRGSTNHSGTAGPAGKCLRTKNDDP